MIDRNPIYALPQTIDQVAEELVNDLDPECQADLKKFDILTQSALKSCWSTIAKEYRLFDGNDKLLRSCIEYGLQHGIYNPCKSIVHRMHSMVNEVQISNDGVVRIT